MVKTTTESASISIEIHFSSVSIENLSCFASKKYLNNWKRYPVNKYRHRHTQALYHRSFFFLSLSQLFLGCFNFMILCGLFNVNKLVYAFRSISGSRSSNGKRHFWYSVNEQETEEMGDRKRNMMMKPVISCLSQHNKAKVNCHTK